MVIIDGMAIGSPSDSVDLSKFQKFDSKKNRVELIEPDFIFGVGSILTFGAEKYEAHNWKKATPDDIERIKGSLLRHTLAYLNGELVDPESGLSHLYHAGCNLMFLDYFDRKGKHEETGF